MAPLFFNGAHGGNSRAPHVCLGRIQNSPKMSFNRTHSSPGVLLEEIKADSGQGSPVLKDGLILPGCSWQPSGCLRVNEAVKLISDLRLAGHVLHLEANGDVLCLGESSFLSSAWLANKKKKAAYL